MTNQSNILLEFMQNIMHKNNRYSSVHSVIGKAKNIFTASENSLICESVKSAIIELGATSSSNEGHLKS